MLSVAVVVGVLRYTACSTPASARSPDCAAARRRRRRRSSSPSGRSKGQKIVRPIGSWPAERFPNERLVDDGDERPVVGVAVVEIAAASSAECPAPQMCRARRSCRRRSAQSRDLAPPAWYPIDEVAARRPQWLRSPGGIDVAPTATTPGSAAIRDNICPEEHVVFLSASAPRSLSSRARSRAETPDRRCAARRGSSSADRRRSGARRPARFRTTTSTPRVRTCAPPATERVPPCLSDRSDRPSRHGARESDRTTRWWRSTRRT